jgi:hypothetical protein
MWHIKNQLSEEARARGRASTETNTDTLAEGELESEAEQVPTPILAALGATRLIAEINTDIQRQRQRSCR